MYTYDAIISDIVSMIAIAISMLAIAMVMHYDIVTELHQLYQKLKKVKFPTMTNCTACKKLWDRAKSVRGKFCSVLHISSI